jgi:solute carrier family 9 (sodium/hydrogen exchanger), member 6/7
MEVIEDNLNVSISILILISLLFIILLTSYTLQVYKIKLIHESIISMMLGMFVGAIVGLTSTGEEHSISNYIAFDSQTFFNFLLPPIILHSGYDMHRKNFFKHFHSILIFAIL